MIRLILAVAVGGAVGTLVRFATGTWIAANWPQHFSLGTFWSTSWAAC
jgi:CrcB protein